MATVQTGSDELIELNPAMRDGLKLERLEHMLSDLRFQPKWREEAAKAVDYYDGNQLTGDRLERMDRLGIPPLITNLIAPAINAALGMEAKSRTDWRVTQQNDVQDAPEELLDALNAKLNEAERESRADRAISDAYAAQLKAGLGWVEVGRSTDALNYPYRVAHVHRDEMWWDWRAKNPDLSDARYVIRRRSFDQDVLIAMMPDKEDMIQWAIGDRFRTWQWDTTRRINTDLAYAAHIERITNIDAMDWRNTERKRAVLYEVWYREWKRGPVLCLPSGKRIPFDPKDQRHVAIMKLGAAPIMQGIYANVRVAFFMGCHRLYDMPSPYSHRHFPYVPFWGYREDLTGVPYGLVRAMISPQDVVNSSDSKMHWMLNSRRLRADSDAIDQKYNTWQNVKENLARADSIVLLDPSKPNSRFREDNDNGLTQEQFNRRQQAARDVESAGGIYRSMLGQESAATSGVAISNLVEQGNVTLAEINDNYQYARRQVGELLFSMVRDDLLHGEVAVAIKKDGKRKLVTLNQRNDAGGIDNEVASVPVKVVLEDVPSTPAFKAQQLQMFTEMIRGLPQNYQAALLDLWIGMTDAPQKDKAIERIKKVAGIPEDMSPEQEHAAQQAQAQAQQAAQEAMQRKQQAETALLEAKVAQLQSQVQKSDSERLVKMVEAMYAAIQAGQVIATNKGVAPVADEILKGAGFSPVAGGQDPGIPPGPADGQATAPVQPTGDMRPEQPIKAEGVEHGIETARNDGAVMQQ